MLPERQTKRSFNGHGGDQIPAEGAARRASLCISERFARRVPNGVRAGVFPTYQFSRTG